VIDPQISIWINSRGLDVEYLDFSNYFLVCFHIIDHSRNLFWKSKFDSPSTDYFFTKSLRPVYPRCPNIMCHNQTLNSLLILRYFSSILCKFSLNILFSSISTRAITLPQLSFKCRVLFFMKISNYFFINWPMLKILFFYLRNVVVFFYHPEFSILLEELHIFFFFYLYFRGVYERDSST
jgi:hypothetical protein